MTLQSDSIATFGETISGLVDLDANTLCLQWRNHMGGSPPAHLPRWLLLRLLAYRIQADALGGLDAATLRVLRQSRDRRPESSHARPFETRVPTTRDGASLRAGALLVREWNGKLERVMVLEKGFAWNGETYSSLSQIARAMTGTSWNGHRFFGLRTAKSNRSATLDRREGFCNGAPVGNHDKVLPRASSLGVARIAAEEMPVVCTTHRRGNRKSASL